MARCDICGKYHVEVTENDASTLRSLFLIANTTPTAPAIRDALKRLKEQLT